MLEKLRSLFASAPKTLPQATETLTSASAEIEALAAELTTRDEKIAALTAELAEAEKQGESATAELATAAAKVVKLDGEVIALSGIVEHITTAIALPVAKDAKAADIKSAFEAHVAKQTTLALAKSGHPPAHVPAAAAIDDVTPPKTEGDASAKAALTSYEALITADNTSSTAATRAAKNEFYTKNHALIARGISLRRRS